MADDVVAHAFSHGFHPQHVERLAAYWAEALGGPITYSDSYGDETTVVKMHNARDQVEMHQFSRGHKDDVSAGRGAAPRSPARLRRRGNRADFLRTYRQDTELFLLEESESRGIAGPKGQRCAFGPGQTPGDQIVQTAQP